MRSQRRLFLEYLDSSILLGETMEVCYENIKATVNLLQELGFTIHPEKFVLLLTKKYVVWIFFGLYYNDHTADRRKETDNLFSL